MSKLTEALALLESRNTRRLSEARQQLQDPETKKIIQSLSSKGASNTAIAEILNTLYKPSFTPYTTTTAKSFFTDKNLPEGAVTKGSKVEYQTVSSFSYKMISDSLSA